MNDPCWARQMIHIRLQNLPNHLIFLHVPTPYWLNVPVSYSEVEYTTLRI